LLPQIYEFATLRFISCHIRKKGLNIYKTIIQEISFTIPGLFFLLPQLQTKYLYAGVMKELNMSICLKGFKLELVI